jgi:hypothetical protein
MDSNRRKRFEEEAEEDRIGYLKQLQSYKTITVKFFRQDEPSKEFMQLIEQQKGKVLSAAERVDIEECRRGWQSYRQMKNKLMLRLGEGKDLLLSHLANKISTMRPMDEKKHVGPLQEYETLLPT